MKWDIDNYSCKHFEKLEKYFHSSKILNETLTKEVANLIFSNYGFMRPTLIGRINQEEMKTPLNIGE